VRAYTHRKTFLTDRPSWPHGGVRHKPQDVPEEDLTLQNPMPFGHPPYSPPTRVKAGWS
jgi:hypothetical protein